MTAVSRLSIAVHLALFDPSGGLPDAIEGHGFINLLVRMTWAILPGSNGRG